MKPLPKLGRMLPWALACTLQQADAQTNPAWWTNPPTVPPPGTTNPPAPVTGTPLPLAVANVGQLKYMAYCATQALKNSNPSLGAQVETALVGPGKPIPSWNKSVSNVEPLAVVNIGQLKAVAAPFYSALNSAHPIWLRGQLNVNGTQSASDPSSFYPWSITSDDDQNRAFATLGQVKAVFALRFEQIIDSDNDGMPNAWESTYGFNGGSSSDASADFDGDGMTNLEEYRRGTHPKNGDTDGDGMPDGWEYSHGLNPLSNGDATLDLDGDLISNINEYLGNSDPSDYDSDDDGLNNFVEVSQGSSPTETDTDRDGLLDYEDIEPLVPIRIQSPTLTLIVWTPN